MDATADEVWAAAYDRVGEDLRAVTKYGASGFETRMREDVREQYTAEEDREIVDDTIVRQLGLDRTERRFDAGDLRAVVTVFDRSWVVAWPDRLPAKSGFIVSIQRDAATMADVDACIRYLDERADSRSG